LLSVPDTASLIGASLGELDCHAVRLSIATSDQGRVTRESMEEFMEEKSRKERLLLG
jgi:hypothetical protein